MKTSNGLAGRRRARISPTQRTEMLARFERSGLSAAAFARQHGLHYTTFCNWRQRQAKVNIPPDFVQVELAAPSAPVELLIELGHFARLRLGSVAQIALAARLLQALNAPSAC